MANESQVPHQAQGWPLVPASAGSLPSWTPRHRWYLPLKFAGDFLCALLLFILCLPVLLLAAVLVKLTSRGPAIYSQTRVGRHGKVFTIYKIRTMTHNCESLTGAQWCKVGDNRVTAIGRFLRKTHIDELPQLWNVLKGDMSLVGPRPERPEFTPQLEQVIPHYSDRLMVRPGVTGLAQVQLPADTDLQSVRRKLAYDLFYVRSLNPWLDLRLVVCTALHLLGIPFRVFPVLYVVPRRELVYRTYVTAVALTTREAELGAGYAQS
jgi:lipopolysaccharide/colanic/teichoic acid biosynthesis glycosyltransferase